AILVAAAAAALVPLPRAAVERFYSQAAYLVLQRIVTAASNRAPFALFDVLLVALGAAWLAFAALDIVRAPRGRAWRSWLRIAGRTAVLAATLYLLFLLAWGLNYRRVPLTGKLGLDPRSVTAEGARRLAFDAAVQLNELHGPAHASGWPAPDAIDPLLADAFARVQRELGASRIALAGRPKRTLLDLYFRRAAVEGMTDPYFLETLVASDLLPFERPFVVAHEWAHLAGFADEGEANFVGWLTCMRSVAA